MNEDGLRAVIKLIDRSLFQFSQTTHTHTGQHLGQNDWYVEL